jgi:cysteine desulfuration protein SufE
MNIQDLLDDFEFLDDWQDRYRYVIELGRKLDPLPEEDRIPANKVQGCASQVWLATKITSSPNHPDQAVLTFVGDSDAHIVRGLISILFVIFSNKHADEIIELDVKKIFHQIGLDEHLSPQRANGLVSMVGRIKSDAQNALMTVR